MPRTTARIPATSLPTIIGKIISALLPAQKPRWSPNTKATLMTYEKKGLMKPKIIKENGYRFYSHKQYPTFMMIKAFQTTGASLSEIAEIVNSHNTESLVKLLEANKAELAKRQIEIMHMHNYVDKVLSAIPYMYSNDSKLDIRYCPEEYLIAVPTGYQCPPKNGYFYSCESAKQIEDYMHRKGYCQFGIADKSDIVTNKNFKKGEFYPSFYWSKLSFKPDDEMLYIKPAGMYATMCFGGAWNDIPTSYKKFKEALKSHNLKYVGDCFMVDVLFSLLLGEEEKCKYTISTRIEQ